MIQRSRRVLQQLGPGLITGAADDDPSGIATYSQAGAQFGYQLGWTLILTYPLMVAIQMVSARMGRVTGHGLADNIRRHFPRPVLYAVVVMLLVANTINVAADIAAMGEALRLVIGGRAQFYSILFGVVCLVLQVFMSYRQYVYYLKWLTLTLLAYVAVVFTVHIPLQDVFLGIFWPKIQFSAEMLTVIVAVFGTTISPYLFFWQAAQEAEDVRADPNANALKLDPTGGRRHLRRIKIDTYIGMGFSNLIALFIVISTAATLHAAGITDIQTSVQAAEALRPLAGEFTFIVFSLGIIGTGLLAVPVLAGSAAYAVSETFQWKGGIDSKLWEAREFYAIVALATIGGVALNFTKIDPIKALFWTAVINGVIAVPIMAVMMLLGANPEVMGTFTIRRRLQILGWLATLIMGAAVLAMVVI
jgi:NRAMP (natural resistance-associated macrophage protein)-like metal ion transporter